MAVVFPAQRTVPAQRAAEHQRLPAHGHRWDFDALRIAAILAVVAIHLFDPVVGGGERGSFVWYVAVAADTMTRWCVPFFVMMSGALLLDPRVHRRGTAAFLRRRVLRLGVPLLVWHLVYLLVVRLWLHGENLSAGGVTADVLDGRVYTALYFLWLILGLYAVAPLLSAYLAGGGSRRAIGLALAGMAWAVAVNALPGLTDLIGHPRPWSQGTLTRWLSYVGLFVAGFAWRHARPASSRARWAIPLALVLFAESAWQFAVAPDLHWLQVLLPVFYTGLPIMAGSVLLFVGSLDLLARLRPSAAARERLRVLGEATFGVFLCHQLVMAVIQRANPRWFGDYSLTGRVTLWTTVVVVAFALTVLARRAPVLRRVF
jgi:surface polysaccharide O-acyltransferase-like enzyme